jgi:uroporphyrinogen-III synthase
MTASHDKALLGERILVTRPSHQSAPLCAELEALGAQALRFPLIEIAAFDSRNRNEEKEAAQIKRQILDLDHYQAVIFISANAAKLGYDWIDEHWPQLPLGITWYAVGKATARSLQKNGIEAQTPLSRMNSEALLALPALQRCRGQRILICRGEGGRELLAETLRERGARVDYLNLYRRRCPCYDTDTIEKHLFQNPPTAILINSVEALGNFVRLSQGTDNSRPRETLHQQRMIVPSQRVADKAREKGFGHIVKARNASDESIIDALIQSS